MDGLRSGTVENWKVGGEGRGGGWKGMKKNHFVFTPPPLPPLQPNHRYYSTSKRIEKITIISVMRKN